MSKAERKIDRDESVRLGQLEAFEKYRLKMWIEAVAAASDCCLYDAQVLTALSVIMTEGIVVSYQGFDSEGREIVDPMSWKRLRAVDQSRGFGYTRYDAPKGKTPIEQAFRMWHLDFVKKKGAKVQLKKRAFYLAWTLEVFD